MKSRYRNVLINLSGLVLSPILVHLGAFEKTSRCKSWMWARSISYLGMILSIAKKLDDLGVESFNQDIVTKPRNQPKFPNF